ncbi:MAG: ROK family protein [Bacteroidales bacterium]
MERKKVVAGVDIGGTNTVLGFVDREGNILVEDRIKTNHYPDFSDFVSALFSKISEVYSKVENEAELIGIGIGAPMGNINKGTIEYPADLPWKGIMNLSGELAKFTALPVVVTNDANAAAVGEMIYGGARGMKNFVVITLGTGLGSGFVVDGKLVYGHDGFAGEIGHTSIRPGESNRDCGCGKKGCIETYASATGLKRTLLKVMADSIEPSPLRKLSFDELDAKIIHDAALQGDKIAINAFEHTGMMLGFKLADVVAHTNPEAIFLFGGLTLAKDLIFEPTKKYMEQNLLSIYRGKVKLLESNLSTQNAAVLGASSLIWSVREYQD